MTPTNLTEADIDLIEGDGERNVINWLYDTAVDAFDPVITLPLDPRELYAHYLAAKPDYIAGEGALTRSDATPPRTDGGGFLPRFVNPAGRTLAKISQISPRHTDHREPEPA